MNNEQSEDLKKIVTNVKSNYYKDRITFCFWELNIIFEENEVLEEAKVLNFCSNHLKLISKAENPFTQVRLDNSLNDKRFLLDKPKAYKIISNLILEPFTIKYGKV